MSSHSTSRTRPTAVERELELSASPDDVWKALTDAGELERWFPLEARVTPGVGGSIWMSWKDDYEAESKIEVWEPARHLRTVFPNIGAVALATDYYLEGSGGHTKLRVVTSGFGAGEDWDDLYDGVRCGWAFELSGLRHYLERHKGRDRRVAQVIRHYTDGRAKAWDRVTAPGGWFGEEGVPASAPGDSYRITTASGSLSGEVTICEAPRQWVGTVEQFNDALLRVEMKGGDREGDVQLWLATYDVEPDRLRALEADWTSSLDRAFSK